MLRSLLNRYLFGSFRDFSLTLKNLQEVPSRLSKTEIFEQYLSKLKTEQILVLRNLFQLSFSKRSRLDDKSLLKGCQSLSTSHNELLSMLKMENDVVKAIAALHKSSTLSESHLTVQKVYQNFVKLNQTEGKASTTKKLQILNNILCQCSSVYEKRTVLSLLTNNLQIGFNKISILKSLQKLNPKIKSLQQHKYDCMLTKPLKSFDEAIKFIDGEKISVEYKFDGERTHIQYSRSNGIMMYSRQGKNQQTKYSDLLSQIQKQLSEIKGLESIILDGQIIAVDQQQTVTNIQVLLNRKNRSNDQERFSEKIMIFDILQKNGEELIHLPYDERIKHIPDFTGKIITNIERNIFTFPQDLKKFKTFFQQAVKIGYEGLILKKIKSKYNTTKSRVDWAKLKKGDSEQGTSGRSVDVDLIMMGAYRGKGKRQGVLGSFLFGTQYQGKIYPITKTGTTLTDNAFKQVTELVKQHAIDEIPAEYVVPKSMDIPDIWIKPHFVVEISSQEWSRSPVYPFNRNQQGGLSLRFPRFIRIRDDKGIQDSTQGQQILEHFNEGQ